MFQGRTAAKEGLVFGHENMGIVVECGSGVTLLKEGDRIVLVSRAWKRGNLKFLVESLLMSSLLLAFQRSGWKMQELRTGQDGLLHWCQPRVCRRCLRASNSVEDSNDAERQRS